MIVVTGGAGFIGSHILAGLNAQGYDDILVVDDLTDGRKFRNLLCSNYYDYQHYNDFLKQISHNVPFSHPITAIIHLGACTTSDEWDGRYVMKSNYSYSKVLMHYCADHDVPFIYASDAAVYGNKGSFDEADTQQQPLNMYAYSKWAFDQYVERLLPDVKNQVVGLRYFSVYGKGEACKGKMASAVHNLSRQLQTERIIRLYGEYQNFGQGEMQRDFIHIDDVVKATLWFLEHKDVKGIYNIGTGQATSFNQLAKELIQLHGAGQLKYIPFPEELKGCYQIFAQADLTRLREAGFEDEFTPLQAGLAKYYHWLEQSI